MTAGDNPNEFKLENPPSDGVSAVKFGPNSSQFLLASSWDCTVRLYDVTANNMRLKYMHSAPVLDCCFSDAVHAYSGGLDKTLKTYDFNTGTETLVGNHEAPIKCVEYCPDVNAVITGSWDSTIKIWDLRAPSTSYNTYNQPDKVYTMSLCGDKLIVGTAQRKIVVWDLRNMAFPQQKRDSSLKYQTRCVAAFPNRQGFVISSIEGRVAVEYLDPSPEVQKKKYAFKCHRLKEDSTEKIFPVNAISFHKIHNTFATGGGDGFVNVWDGFHKKRLCQFHKYPSGISSLSFSNDGSLLAIGGSQFDTGEPQVPVQDFIYFRKVSDQETKPK